MANFDIEKFRSLLRQGIGSRKQNAFAKDCGMSPATLSRWLSGSDFPCPKQATLERIAPLLYNVKPQEFFAACGYHMDTLEERIQKFESDIDDFFQFSCGTVFPGMEELVGRLTQFLKDPCKLSADHEKQIEIPKEYAEKGAEEAAEVTADWSYGGYLCTTVFQVFYLTTAKNRAVLDIGYVFSDPAEDDPSFPPLCVKKRHLHTEYRSDRASVAEQRLLNAIFPEVRPYTYAGYGFYFTGCTSSQLFDFINKYSAYFCTTPERCKAFQLAAEGQDIYSMLREYPCFGKDSDYIKEEELTDKSRALIAGLVISEVLSAVSGMDFEYFAPCSDLPEEQRNSVIMTRICEEEPGPASKNVLVSIAYAASTLQISSFGLVYYNTVLTVNKKWYFETDKFINRF